MVFVSVRRKRLRYDLVGADRVGVDIDAERAAIEREATERQPVIGRAVDKAERRAIDPERSSDAGRAIGKERGAARQRQEADPLLSRPRNRKVEPKRLSELKPVKFCDSPPAARFVPVIVPTAFVPENSTPLRRFNVVALG